MGQQRDTLVPRLRTAVALLAAAGLLFIASWTLIPAPTYSLLTFSVGAPEVCGWLLVIAIVTAATAAADWRRYRAARAAFVFAMVAFVLEGLPLARFPLVARRFAQSVSGTLGDDGLRGVPNGVLARMRPAPLVLTDLLRGIPASEARVARGIVFAEAGGARLTLDVYRPMRGTLSPIVVQIYGGAWQRGAPGNYADFARHLAGLGYVVFAIDYRHAPRWHWPAQLDDVRTALAFVRAHAAEYGGDSSRLALIGRSAGAHLALLAAYDPTAPPVRAVVSYYGPVDLTDAYRHPPSPDPLHVRETETAFIGGTPDDMPAQYRAASPITYVSGALPPTLLIYGSRDHIVEPRYGRLLDERLRAAGATSMMLEIPWADHAFDAVPNGPSAQLAMYHVERFLDWALYGQKDG
ncbi:MAG: alpha/beta hydrolase, partial [Gemmatimonadaceae bacterium]